MSTPPSPTDPPERDQESIPQSASMGPAEPTPIERTDAALEDQELTGRAGALIAGMWNTAQMVVPLLGTTVVSIVIGRVLGPAELGEQSWISYIEALLVTVLIQTMVRAGIQTLATARGANDEAMFNAIARWTTMGQYAAGVVSALVLFGFSFFSDYPQAWWFVSVTAVLNAIGWSYSTRIIAVSGWSKVAQRRLITQLLAQGVAVVLVVQGFGIVGVFAANAIAALILVIALGRLAVRVEGPLFPPLPQRLLRVWWLYLVTELLVQVVARRIEFLFLGTMSTKDQLAMYSIAFMVVTSVVLIPDSVVSAVLPSLASQAGAGRSDVVDRHLAPAIRVIALISVPLTAGIAVLGPRLVTMLYGEEFAQAGSLVSWMAILLLFVPVFDMLDTYWGGFGRLGIPLVAVAVGGVIDIGLAFALVGPYGAAGATAANVSGQALTALVLIVLTKRRLPSLTMAWGRYLLVAVVSVAAGAFGWWIQAQIPGLPGWCAALMAMGAILVAVGATVGLIGRADALWLRDSLPDKLRPATRWVGGRATV